MWRRASRPWRLGGGWRRALGSERRYLAHDAERMTYPEFRLEGLPIGSGAIESAADHLLQRRMKRAGMRWSEAGGDALLALRARLRSGRPLILPDARVPHPDTRRPLAA